MNAIWARITAEPVLVTTLVQTILILAVSFGLDVTKEQTAAILALSGAILALVARQNVTPS
jgi:hypothetical protein